MKKILLLSLLVAGVDQIQPKMSEDFAVATITGEPIKINEYLTAFNRVKEVMPNGYFDKSVREEQFFQRFIDNKLRDKWLKETKADQYDNFIKYIQNKCNSQKSLIEENYNNRATKQLIGAKRFDDKVFEYICFEMVDQAIDQELQKSGSNIEELRKKYNVDDSEGINYIRGKSKGRMY